MGLLEIERPHVVHAVSQLDDGHADVVRHRKDHFTDVLRLLLFLAVERHHADLGHAVHDVGDLFAELGVNLFERDFRVFDRIVQLPGMGRCGISIGFAYERLFRFRGIGSQPAQDVLHRQGKMGGRSFNCTHGLVLWADGA